MIWGRSGSTGRVALVAAAGALAASVSARAADLGGDCCADLEERVAELEATTARKGNRKMSLTITGQVNRAVMWWDDGHVSKAYYGVDNTNSSSRFSMLGKAKVTSHASMGFDITVELSAGGNTSSMSQFNEDSTFSSVGNPISAAGSLSFNSANNDPFLDMRRAAWWIEHKDLGRLTVGRYESAGAITTIDLAGIGIVAGPNIARQTNANFFLRGPAGQVYTTTYFNVADPGNAQGRTELVRYDSPTMMGFIASGSVGEAGDIWGTMLRYAGEFSGVRIAAGVGYEKIDDCVTPAAFAGSPLVAAQGGAPGGYCVGGKPDIAAWGAGLSLMHAPSGLFVQGHYNAIEYGNPTAAGSLYWGHNATNKKDANLWLIQGGIAKTWFGLGNTALYGEYGRADDWGAGLGAGRDYATPAGTTGFTPLFDVTNTEVGIWGLGITQNIDAAATTLYLGYRNFSSDITGAPMNGGGKIEISTEDLHVVLGGARVRF
jgi:hypothetical protein